MTCKQNWKRQKLKSVDDDRHRNIQALASTMGSEWEKNQGRKDQADEGECSVWVLFQNMIKE